MEEIYKENQDYWKESQEKIVLPEEEKHKIGKDSQQKIDLLDYGKETHEKRARIEKMEEEGLKMELTMESSSEENMRLESDAKYQDETIKLMNSKKNEIVALKDTNNLEKGELKSLLDRDQGQSNKVMENNTINNCHSEESSNGGASNSCAEHARRKQESNLTDIMAKCISKDFEMFLQKIEQQIIDDELTVDESE